MTETSVTSVVPTVVKLVTAAIVCAVLFMIVISAMTSPVKSPTKPYVAEFTDVSGLRVNGDVRTKGVRIGKVNAMRIVERDGVSVAEVDFTMDDTYQLTDTSVMSIKYQNLTGARYIDVVFPEHPGISVDRMDAAHTHPSFDITDLFNGLQPVLATMRTEDIDKFTENALTVLQGDGGGLQPMLDNLATLTDLAHDREAVISTLVGNLARIADTMGGRSPQVIELLRSVSIPVERGMTVLDEFRKTATYGPAFLAPVDTLLANIGLRPGVDVEELVTSQFSNLSEAAEAIRLIPVSLAGLQLPSAELGSTRMPECTNGIAQLPTDVDVLLGASEVVVCAPR